MSALVVSHIDQDGRASVVRFAYQDGRMTEALELVGDYLMAAGIPESVWEGVAADRLGTILAQNEKLREMKRQVDELREWAAFTKSPLAEVAR